MAVSRRSRKSRDFLVQKPQGQITQRVQAVGPQHFGIVCVDCAKARSKFFLCNFFGHALLPPTEVQHSEPEFRAAIERIRGAIQEHSLQDLVVAIERTGTYHRAVQQAFRQAGFETRLVHPYTSKQYRQPADPGYKTDDTDLAAIFRATVNGFGILEPCWPDEYQQLQWLSRLRRDLVQKNAALRCQIREYLHALMPGYADCFGEHFFESSSALSIARQTGSAAAVLSLELEGLRRLVPAQSCRLATLARIVDWARVAPTEPHPHTPLLRAALERFEDDRLEKTRQIHGLEQQIAHQLARTPYVLLLALPGINVVGAADLAGELGPMLHYANANRITGRAGLMPSRYQSDRVDRPDGPLRRRGNRRLRAALLQIADNLVQHNHYFSAKNERWRRQKKHPVWIRIKVAKSFSRLLFVLLTNRCLYPHPACQQRHYILDKLLTFHRTQDTDMKQVLNDLDQAARHFPTRTRQEEGRALYQTLQDIQARRRGPVALASIIPLVLARLGISTLQSGQDLS